MRKKVTIVGAGNVGATAAHWIAAKELADVVLVDVVEGVPQGKALDLLEAVPIEKRDVTHHRHQRLRGHGEFGRGGDHGRHCAQAGHEPRRSVEDELQDHRSDVVTKVVRCFAEHDHHRGLESAGCDGADGVQAGRGFRNERVIGMAGVLDSARYPVRSSREELNVSVENVTAFVLGGHGDTMVPLPRYSTWPAFR